MLIYNHQLFGFQLFCLTLMIFAIAIIIFMISGKRRDESPKEIRLCMFTDDALSQGQEKEEKFILVKGMPKKQQLGLGFAGAGFPASDFS